MTETSQKSEKIFRPFYKRWSYLAGAGIALIAGAACLWNAKNNTANSLETALISNRAAPGRLEAIARSALETTPPNLDRAEQALLTLLERQPKHPSAWNQLAYIDSARNGQPSRDGLLALMKSYEVSAYGDLEMMIWRVNFASRYWSALPTELRGKTLSQLPVIEKFGASWPWRVEQCKNNPHPTLYEAICAISPGVVRPATPRS